MNAPQKEDLRKVILEVIALRHPTALTVQGIRRRAEPELDFKITDEDVTAALQFLKGLGLATVQYADLGSSQHWQCTSKGVLANERGEVPPSPHTTE
jgi:hypothetical protein